MDVTEYYRGKKGRKYGIWNTVRKSFEFGIKEDSPFLAQARLHYLIGYVAYRQIFVPKRIPLQEVHGDE